MSAKSVKLSKGAMITILGVPEGLQEYFAVKSSLGQDTEFVQGGVVQFNVGNDDSRVIYLKPAEFMVEKAEENDVVIRFQALPGWPGTE